MFRWLRRAYYKQVPHYLRLELRCVTYWDGDKLIRQNEGKKTVEECWRIAPEEDRNRVMGTVWLERVSRIWE